MTEIDIPFSREMVIAAIEGRKIATTRSEPKGKVGDVFQIENPNFDEDNIIDRMWSYPRATFCLIDIFSVDLTVVKQQYYRLEGFDSPEAFEKTWRALHRGHFTVNKPYYIHFFGRVI